MDDRTCAAEDCGATKLQARGFCARHYQAWKRANTGRTKTCTECGQQYRTIETRSSVCSRACRSKAAQRGTTAVRYPDRVTTLCVFVRNTVAPTTVVKTQGEGSWCAGNCIVCHTPFVSRLRGTTCSATCQAIVRADYLREKAHRRRARELHAYVAPVRRSTIYERDGYCCQLCGLPATMDAVVPHPLAPTLDHIIPIARGGTHEPANAQLAHFICNSTKRDTIEHLALTA